MRSGSRLLRVTLSAATSKDMALLNAVKPVRAVVDNAWCGLGLLTMAEVMLTMRPNFRARMPGNTPRMSKMGANILPSRASSQAAWSQSLNCPGLGPALLLTRISTSPHWLSSNCLPASVLRSANAVCTLTPVLLSIRL